jgi:hypothetical protein
MKVAMDSPHNQSRCGDFRFRADFFTTRLLRPTLGRRRNRRLEPFPSHRALFATLPKIKFLARKYSGEKNAGVKKKLGALHGEAGGAAANSIFPPTRPRGSRGHISRARARVLSDRPGIG